MTFFGRAQSPNASVARTIDYSDDLAGATISTSTWTVTGGTEADSSNTTTTTTIEVSGGSGITPIVAVNNVTASDGQTYEKSITIPVDAT